MPKIQIANTIIGIMLAKVTPVNYGEISIMMTSTISKKSIPRVNIEILVLSPSYIISMSEVSLDRRSPDLRSSKKAMSLFKIDSK